MDERKRFLNKINKRLKTLSNTFDIDKEQITDHIGIDGVYTTDAGNITIDKSFWSEEVANRLDKLIPTMTQEREAATNTIIKSKIATFQKEFGHAPATINITGKDVKHEVQAKYKVKDAWEDIRNEYYGNLPTADLTDEFSPITKKLQDAGSRFYKGEMTYGELLDLRDEVQAELKKLTSM